MLYDKVYQTLELVLVNLSAPSVFHPLHECLSVIICFDETLASRIFYMVDDVKRFLTYCLILYNVHLGIEEMGVGGNGPVETRVNSSSTTDVSVIHKVQIKPFNASSME